MRSRASDQDRRRGISARCGREANLLEKHAIWASITSRTGGKIYPSDPETRISAPRIGARGYAKIVGCVFVGLIFKETLTLVFYG